MKRWSFYLVMVALVLAIVAPASADLLFDRGLPTANLNNAAGTSRSNIAWANGDSAANSNPYDIYGDDFSISGTGTYHLDTIRVWIIKDGTTDLKLYGGSQGGSISALSSTFTATPVTYTNTETYQGSSGAYSNIYQIDFAVNFDLAANQTYQFFVDGLVPYGSTFITPFLHASNGNLSGSTQEGFDDLLLQLTMTGGSPGAVASWDSNAPNVWDKSSDFNVQVLGSQVPLPGALVLLGAGLVRLARYGRRKKALI